MEFKKARASMRSKLSKYLNNSIIETPDRMQKLPYSTIVIRTTLALGIAAAANIAFVACTTQAENLKNENVAPVFQGVPVDAAVTASGAIKDELEVTGH